MIGTVGHRRWAAAAIALLLIAGMWWFNSRRSMAAEKKASIDIPAPDRNRSVITLVRGQEILTNPRGSTVADITLSDGTRVWLNAASSLRYPAVFSDNDRTVDLDGEAYFEVTPDDQKPFHVRKSNMRVDVLGTTFDIRAYSDPLTYVTLLDGRLRITAANTLVLRSGEQAVIQDRAEMVKDADPEAVTAWKHGLFSFSHTNMIDAMRELGRWYDVNVVYDNHVSDRYFTGRLDRTLSLDQVLKTLTDGRLHYSIDTANRQLKIMP